MYGSIDDTESISLLDYTNPDNYVYYGTAAAGILLLIVLIIMIKKGKFEKIKKVCLSNETICSKPLRKWCPLPNAVTVEWMMNKATIDITT